MAVKSEYEEAEAAVQALVQRITLMGGVLPDSRAAAQQKARRERGAQRLKAVLDSIHELGCLIKDLDTGLVDFPTLFRGREVYLCWKLGEPRIAFWHGVEEGFAGRKPIDQDFLDNHQGDPIH
jgi:hypothetical protein